MDWNREVTELATRVRPTGRTPMVFKHLRRVAVVFAGDTPGIRRCLGAMAALIDHEGSLLAFAVADGRLAVLVDDPDIDGMRWIVRQAAGIAAGMIPPNPADDDTSWYDFGTQPQPTLWRRLWE